MKHRGLRDTHPWLIFLLQLWGREIEWPLVFKHYKRGRLKETVDTD